MQRSAYLSIFLGCSLLAMLAVAGINFYIDPFTYYHSPWTAINISKNHRYSNPGLAKHQDYEAVLVGTSHVMEIGSDQLSRIMKRPAINLSIAGGLIREQSDLLEVILGAGKAENVLWEMNYSSFSVGGGVSENASVYPDYLYHPEIETPFRYLMSFDTLMKSRLAISNPGQITLDNRDQRTASEFSEERVLKNWDFQIARWDEALVQIWVEHQSTVEKPEELLEKFVLPLLLEHPGIQFDLFLSPTSELFLLLFESLGESDFERWLDYRDVLANMVDGLPNVRLHDFQLVPAWTEDFDRYRDLEHFDMAILQELLEHITNGSSVTDTATVHSNSQLLRNKVLRNGQIFCSNKPGRCPVALQDRINSKVE